nr:hypothetical protein CFP56_43680 [Quercus suber]
MASKASLADQQSQVQENVHAQVKIFAMSMDEILFPNNKRIGDAHELPPPLAAAPRWNGQPTDRPSMGVGFKTGFWAICGALFFNRTWRHAFFRFADDIKDQNERHHYLPKR